MGIRPFRKGNGLPHQCAHWFAMTLCFGNKLTGADKFPRRSLQDGGRNNAMADYMEILRELREDSDLTQAQVAAILQTTQQVYARYEKGINELPVRHLRSLCAFYKVSADYILQLPEGLGRPR